MSQVNDWFFHYQWGVRRVRFPEAWDLIEHEQKKPVSVAIIDTGIARHEDLPGPVSYHGFGESATDLHGHGTSVAGILCAIRNNDKGIAGATECDLSVYRVVDQNGWNWKAYYSALRRLPADGVRIVNLSVGGEEMDPTEQFLLSICMAAGIIVVAAAGNHGWRGNPTIYPAAIDGVIAVSGVNNCNTLTPRSSSGPFVFIAAPGDSFTTSLGNSYRVMEGTSFATPLVTGALALALSVRPRISANAIKTFLGQTAEDVTGRGKTAEFGHGILDVKKLVEEILKIQ